MTLVDAIRALATAKQQTTDLANKALELGATRASAQQDLYTAEAAFTEIAGLVELDEAPESKLAEARRVVDECATRMKGIESAIALLPKRREDARVALTRAQGQLGTLSGDVLSIHVDAARQRVRRAAAELGRAVDGAIRLDALMHAGNYMTGPAAHDAIGRPCDVLREHGVKMTLDLIVATRAGSLTIDEMLELAAMLEPAEAAE